MIKPTISVQAIDGDGEVTDWFEVQVSVEESSNSVDFARVGGARRGMTWMVDLADFEAALKLIAAERKRSGSEA